MYEIILAEDDCIFRGALTEALRDEGYRVRAVANGRLAVEAFIVRAPDLVLLDVDMPMMNGIDACAEIRRRDPWVPIMFLSGYDDLSSHLKGLSVGADDYMDKTMSEEERRLRIHRALVRSRLCEPSNQFPFGELTVDPEAFCLISADGSRVPLTTREVEILRHLSVNRGAVIPWDAFQSRFWGIDDDDPPDKLRQAVRRIREKLGPAAVHLQTVKGLGIVYE